MMRVRIRKFLNNKYVDLFLVALILFTVICLAFETDKDIYTAHKAFFDNVELVSVIIFTIEYLLRLMTFKKFKSIFKPLMLIDLISIIPFYLPIIFDFRFLRMFRLIRILRILRISRLFKLARYFKAIQLIGKIIYKKRHELLTIFGLLIFSVFISSFFMYYAEAEAQPTVFKNILDTFWWSLVTFTTVGYGDMIPITTFGKIISGTIVIIGIMLFALPTSILTAEYLNEVQKQQKKKKHPKKKNKSSKLKRTHCCKNQLANDIKVQ